VAGQRDDHRRAQPWHPQRQAARRDPLLRLEFAHWRQGPTQSHPAALVNREQLALGAGCATEGGRPPIPRGQRRSDPGHAAQPGHQCPAPRWDLVDHRGHRRPRSRHQRPAQAAGLEISGGDALRMTSNRPWGRPLRPSPKRLLPCPILPSTAFLWRWSSMNYCFSAATNSGSFFGRPRRGPLKRIP